MSYYANRNGMHTEHPIDLDTELSHRSDWSVKAVEDNVVELTAAGLWRTYDITVGWLDKYAALMVEGGFVFKPPAQGAGALRETLDIHNEQIVFGHFTFDDGYIRFRYALSANPLEGPPPKALGRLVDLTLEACDTLYPALRMVVSGRYNPDEALDAAMMEPVGSA